MKCICGKNRESVTKDKKNWVSCEVCPCWAHPSCYKLAQVVVAQDDVRFICFLCAMSIFVQFQDFIARQEVRSSDVIAKKESLATTMKETEGKIEEIWHTLEAETEDLRRQLNALKSCR